MNLMHQHVMKIHYIVPEGGGSSGHHQVGLHHVEPHALLVHPLNHQGAVTLHRDWGAGQPDYLEWRLVIGQQEKQKLSIGQ